MVEKLKYQRSWILVRKVLWCPDDSLQRAPTGPFDSCWSGRGWVRTAGMAQQFETADAAVKYLAEHRELMRA